MTTLPAFLLARLAEDEAAAREAVETPGAEAWHWIRAEDDTVATPDPSEEYLTEGGDVSLRSIAELRATHNGRMLPDFAIWRVDDMRAGVADHIARHDPARVLADVAAKRAIVDLAWMADEEGAEPVYLSALRALASVYRDHPEFDEGWAL